MLNSKVASSTRTRSVAEEKFPDAQQLKWISCFPNLLKLAEQKLRDHEMFKNFLQDRGILNPQDTFGDDALLFHALHPIRTGTGLPPIVCSEADTTSWNNAKLVWPAIYFLQCMLKHNSKAGRTNEPSISSCYGERHVGTPDAVLIDNIIKLSMEWKTHNALSPAVLAELDQISRHTKAMWNFKTAARVWWSSGWSQTLEKQTKILFQVWGQMAAIRRNEPKGINFACLSSFNSTLIFYRDPNQPNTLFMSDSAQSLDELNVLKFASLFALALGIIKLEAHEIPQFDERCMQYANNVIFDENSDVVLKFSPGVDPGRSEVYDILRGYFNDGRSKERAGQKRAREYKEKKAREAEEKARNTEISNQQRDDRLKERSRSRSPPLDTDLERLAQPRNDSTNASEALPVLHRDGCPGQTVPMNLGDSSTMDTPRTNKSRVQPSRPTGGSSGRGPQARVPDDSSNLNTPRPDRNRKRAVDGRNKDSGSVLVRAGSPSE
ncbi:hypothetical protein EUX98_g2632 [Antrodiella citrinella]|uniref:Uncharacterized protein n=1 Tax=Antrodiella citrinella TaxID=2447956 RepID=A0A4S4N6R5_9APHY|nr:hypothetical protein EUX98_g2632 [Antrodiella citrinella]